MSGKVLFLSALMATPAVEAMVHAVFCRVAKRMGFDPASGFVVIVSILFSGAMIVWALFLGVGISFWALIYFLTVFSAVSLCYFILFAMTEAARRIRILYELYTSGSRELVKLEEDYGGSVMLDIRLNRMESLGQLEFVEGKYYAKGHAVFFVSHILCLWARFLRLGDGA